MAFRPGFADRWTSEEDFVLGITRDIWEDRGIHTLHDYYGPELVVRSPASVIKGNAGIVAATEATLAEFPDRELLGEDVIWADAGPEAFLSSHRLICTATHSGAGMYGPPSGRKLCYRIIADCFCTGNAVADEWLVRDQGAIVRQMGEEPRDWTRRLIDREGGATACVRPMTPANDMPGPYTSRGNGNAWAGRLSGILSAAMDGDFAAFARGYDRAAQLSYWSHTSGHGHEAAARQWLGLRAAFPSAIFRVEHAIGSDRPDLPPRAALRWSLQGKHDGHGPFGAPTGAEVYIMGMTHAEFWQIGSGSPLLRREWTLIDETALWKQILLATG